jgi:hypothetical protein
VCACIILRKTLASKKDKGQKTRDGGTEDVKQRSKGQKHWDKKGDTGTVVRQGTEDERQEAEL